MNPRLQFDVLKPQEHDPLGTLFALFPVFQGMIPEGSKQAHSPTKHVENLINRVAASSLVMTFLIPQPVGEVPKRDEHVLRVPTQVHNLARTALAHASRERGVGQMRGEKAGRGERGEIRDLVVDVELDLQEGDEVVRISGVQGVGFGDGECGPIG